MPHLLDHFGKKKNEDFNTVVFTRIQRIQALRSGAILVVVLAKVLFVSCCYHRVFMSQDTSRNRYFYLLAQAIRFRPSRSTCDILCDYRK